MHRTVTIHDVNKRLRSTKNKGSIGYLTEFRASNEITIKNKIPGDIIRSIESAGRHNPVVFESVLNLFDALYECGTTSQLNSMANYICEEVVSKVRDAKETNTNLRRKLGRAKSKVTSKIDNNISDALGAVHKAVGAAGSNFKSNTNKIKNNVNKGLGRVPSNKNDHKKNDAKNEAYINALESFIEATDTIMHCDRILENYNNISKRFNIEKVIIENTRMYGFEDSVLMPDTVKFNTVIESAWYGFEHNGIKYDKKKLLETATDYFLLRNNGYDTCKSILEDTVIYDPEDMPEDMEVIREEDPEEEEAPTVFDRLDGIAAQFRGEIAVPEDFEPVKENYDFNKLFSYKKSNETENPNKLKELVTKLYAKNVDNIIEDTPNFLNWIRQFLVLGTFAINPIIGCIVAIGDIFARLKFEREETEKMIKCFDEELKKANERLKNPKDENEKARLKAYIDALKKSRKKINEYYEDMLSDKELDEKLDKELEAEDNGSDSDSEDDSDLDFGDDEDWDDEFEEAVHTINGISAGLDAVMDNPDISLHIVRNIGSFNEADIINIAKFAREYPSVYNKDLLEAAYTNQRNKIRKKQIYESNMERYRMLNAYGTGLEIMKESTNSEDNPNLEALGESIECINNLIWTYKYKDCMLEASISNTLKLASENLKKALVKASDKEKQVSRDVDVSLSNLRKSVERSVANDNQEAIIRGSVLPNASKIIKHAIVTGGLALINPAIAAIEALTVIALSKHTKKKERQLVLDDLDVELQMCEKQLELADRKDDMKAYRDLLRIQKELKRKQQRIKYKMKVDFNEAPPDTNNN
jgi:hypothetical protein